MNEQIIDPLDIPAGSCAEPEFPILREGIYKMLIRGFEKKQYQGKDGKPDTEALSIKLATMGDAIDTEGRKLHPGFSFNTSIFLTPNENNSLKQIGEQAAMPIKAALGVATTVKAKDCVDNPSLILDKVVEVKVGIRKGKGDYSDSNTVKTWIVPKA